MAETNSPDVNLDRGINGETREKDGSWSGMQVCGFARPAARESSADLVGATLR
jgi:hypothetical protein